MGHAYDRMGSIASSGSHQIRHRIFDRAPRLLAGSTCSRRSLKRWHSPVGASLAELSNCLQAAPAAGAASSAGTHQLLLLTQLSAACRQHWQQAQL